MPIKYETVANGATYQLEATYEPEMNTTIVLIPRKDKSYCMEGVVIKKRYYPQTNLLVVVILIEVRASAIKDRTGDALVKCGFQKIDK